MPRPPRDWVHAAHQQLLVSAGCLAFHISAFMLVYGKEFSQLQEKSPAVGEGSTSGAGRFSSFREINLNLGGYPL